MTKPLAADGLTPHPEAPEQTLPGRSDAIEHVIAATMNKLRVERGWTQFNLAHRMAAVGVDWTSNRVAQIETCRGKVSIFETIALSWVFGVPLPRLLDSDGAIAYPNGRGAISLDAVRAVLAGELTPPPAAANGDAEEIRKIARDLGITPADLDRMAHELWGRPFTAERDARTATVPGSSQRSTQAKRGHTSRALIREISRHAIAAWTGAARER